ncbi:MAG: TraB/GumN family protein, partial [Pseudomonadota bacterium]
MPDHPSASPRPAAARPRNAAATRRPSWRARGTGTARRGWLAGLLAPVLVPVLGLALAPVLGLVLAPAAAAEACAGEDLLDRLAREDPAAHAAILAEGAAIPNGDARLWRIAIPGTDTPASHLFGTYHDTETLATLTPAVETAFAAATRLVVELDAAEVAAMQDRIAADPAFSLRADPVVPGEGLADRLDAAGRAAADRALARRGLSLALADRLAPWLLFSALGVPACELAAMAEGEVVMDRGLMDRAEARGIPVTGLESYESALATFDALPDAAVADLLADSIALAEIEEDLRATMIGLYAEGRIGVLAATATAVTRRRSARAGPEAERLEALFHDLV